MDKYLNLRNSMPSDISDSIQLHERPWMQNCARIRAGASPQWCYLVMPCLPLADDNGALGSLNRGITYLGLCSQVNLCLA